MHLYIHKTPQKICFIPVTPFFTSPFLKSISLLKRFKVRRLPSSREFHFCCMASAFASLWSNNELLLAYGEKRISYRQWRLGHGLSNGKINQLTKRAFLLLDGQLWIPSMHSIYFVLPLLACTRPTTSSPKWPYWCHGTAHTSGPYASC